MLNQYLLKTSNSLSGKRFFITTFLVGIGLIAASQDPSVTNQLQSVTKLDIGLQGIGITSERRLSNHTTIDASLGFSGTYNIEKKYIQYASPFHSPAFYISLSPKFFYNREKQVAAGNASGLNNGNYIGLRLKTMIQDLTSNHNRDEMVLVNAHWGTQRSIGNRWSVNGHVGIGYIMISPTDEIVYPSLDCKFSYNFLKKRK